MSRFNPYIVQGTIPKSLIEEFPQIGGSDNYENLRWEIPVAMKNVHLGIRAEKNLLFESNIPNLEYSVVLVVLFCIDWMGGLGFYYSDNEDNYTVEATFPVVNLQQEMGPGDGDGDDGLLGGAVGDSLPGFGLAAGLGALAMAAIASSRREE